MMTISAKTKVAVLFLAVIAALLFFWLLWPNYAARVSWALRSRDYQAAAAWTLKNSERPAVGELSVVDLPARWKDLTPGGLAIRFTEGGSDFVYLIAGGEVTMSDGLLYSSSGRVASPEWVVGRAARLNSNWWNCFITVGF